MITCPWKYPKNSAFVQGVSYEKSIAFFPETPHLEIKFKLLEKDLNHLKFSNKIRKIVPKL